MKSQRHRGKKDAEVIASASLLCSDCVIDRLPHARNMRHLETAIRIAVEHMDSLYFDNRRLRKLLSALIPFAQRNPTMRRAIAKAMR